MHSDFLFWTNVWISNNTKQEMSTREKRMGLEGEENGEEMKGKEWAGWQKVQ